MKRTAYSAASVAAFMAAISTIYYFGVRSNQAEKASLWLVFVPMAFGVLGIVCLYKALSDNIYNLKSGVVVAHRFAPAYTTPAIWTPVVLGSIDSLPMSAAVIPACRVDAEWSLQVLDGKGHTGWLHFGLNVLEQYPVGSFYPERVVL